MERLSTFIQLTACFPLYHTDVNQNEDRYRGLKNYPSALCNLLSYVLKSYQTHPARSTAHLPPEELAEIPSAPGSLDEALEALREDHDFLLKGDVFTKDVIDTWIEYKIENEVNAVKLRPHPHEFFLYFDI